MTLDKRFYIFCLAFNFGIASNIQAAYFKVVFAIHAKWYWNSPVGKLTGDYRDITIIIKVCL